MPNPHSLFHDRPTIFLNSVRFYAVPVQFQVKPKNEEDDTDGPRLNDQIKARQVRLVVDGEHSIVSRFEALERARKLKLDLVEVDKNSTPPVCKIMDYHKEMYKKKENFKERAKSKSEMTMKKECKEVRFSEKTESKDLKMKSDMVRKLMEKGYRVKVKATGNADQAMLDAISRLSALIEDVCVVESGPHLAKKDAYIIVRHLKYGPAKKGAKKSQDAVRMDSKAEEGDVEPLTTNSSNSVETPDTLTNSINDGNDSVSPPVVENRYKKANYRVENKFQSNAQAPPDVTENRYKQAEPRNRYQHENRFQPNAQVPPVVTENRYIQAEPRNRYQQTTPNTSPGTRDANRWIENKVQSNAQVPPVAVENRYIKAVPRNRYQQTAPNTSPGTRDANRWTPSNLNNTRNVHVNNFNPNTESTNQAIDKPNGPQTVQRNR